MTWFDLTADAQEYREIASLWHGGQASALYAYASSGTIVPGLSMEIRRCMREAAQLQVTFENAAASFHLGRLLGHVSPLEDQLREEEP